MSNIESVVNSIASVLAGSSDMPDLDALTSIVIVERWDARHGRFSAHVNMDAQDDNDFNVWLDINMSSYLRRVRSLKNAIEDIKDIFPGIPDSKILEAMYRYY